jgi:histidyl-tRNA synthetase
MQFDADTVGSGSPAADAEMCMMAADTMEALGIPRGSYVVKVNNRKVLDGILESIGLSGEANASRRLLTLRAIDKLDRLGAKGVTELLGAGRLDESGDFTAGALLSADEIDRVLRFFQMDQVWSLADASDSKNGSSDLPLRSIEALKADRFADEAQNLDLPGRYFSNAGLVASFEELVADSEVGRIGLEELSQIVELANSGGYGSRRIRIDPSVVRGLEYYTGPVYEVELLLDTKDEKGRPVRFGSVGGGGRYDGLVSRFRGEPVPATGFSIGVSRLQAALTLLGKLDTGKEFGPVVVTVFDRDRVADYQKMVALLRNANIRAELYLGNPKNMGNQLKYADRRNSPCVIIQGSDEKARGEVQIKDLIEGAKAAAAIASNQEWRETRPAQFSCSEDEIVAKVRDVLARHDVKWG